MPDPHILVFHGGCHKLRPGGSRPIWTYRCRNRTGEPIHDLYLDTDLTNGVDPKIKAVRVYVGGQLVSSFGGGSDTNAHIGLNPALGPGAEFDLYFECDGPFESDERIEICPTNDRSAAIEGVGSAPDKWKRIIAMHRGCMPLHPASRLKKWSFWFRNRTGVDIHDLHMNTDLTNGDDPDLLHVAVEYDGRLIANQSVPDESQAHVVFTEKVPPGRVFRVTFECDDWFEDDEAIEFCPTSEHGAVLDVPVTTVGRWPCSDDWFFSPWKWIREHIPPFTVWGWTKGGDITVEGRVTGTPYCYDDGDYCFDLQLCREARQRAARQASGISDAAFPGGGRQSTIHCEITPAFQSREPPRTGRFYRVEGQLRYDRGHEWWEVHPAKEWPEIEPCDLAPEK